MTWWQRLRRKREQEDRLDRELRFHLESRIADNIRAGMSEEEARRHARLEFGGIEGVKEECREARGTAWLDSTWQDIRFSLRLLRKTPAFTVAAVCTLALGIGANTAIFTIIDAVMLKMLPVRNPGELIQLSRYYQDQRSNFSYPWYQELRDQSHSSSGVFAVSNNSPSKVRIGEENENIDCQYVTGN